MTGRVVLLDQIDGREAAALLVDGRLEDFFIDPVQDGLLPGAICRALPDRPVKGLGGLFVKLPGGAQGFLRETRGITPGRALIVQVTGPAEPGKAWPVTTRLLFRSRYCIVTPGAPGHNISRQIRDEPLRIEIAALADHQMLGADEGLGLIVRSAAAHADLDEVADDIGQTRALAQAVLADLSGGPELLVDAPSAHEAAWRDWADPPPDAVEQGSFDAHDVPNLLNLLLSVRVDLPGGGHMAIEPTRALVAVDVNTGPDTSPAAGLKASIAAARDLPRQLRLRGLGGQVVIDFAPFPKKDRHILDQVLRAAFRAEGGEANLAGWTPLGLYELTRRRDRTPLISLLPKGV